MKRRAGVLCDWLYRSLLRGASALAPASHRGEWLNEWRTELWYARQACAAGHGSRWRMEWQLAVFCLGALRDARSLEDQHGAKRVPLATTRGSATQCTALLVTLLALATGTGVLVPGIRMHLMPAHAHDAQSLMLIQNAQAADSGDHTLSAAQYENWKDRRQHIFQSFAFYKVDPVSNGPSDRQLRVARASENIFDVLGSPVRPSFRNVSGSRDGVWHIVLSRELWKSDFGADSSVVGQQLRVGTHTAIVEAIAPPGTSALPGRPDVWLLTPDAQIPAVAKGFVIGRLKPSFGEPAWGDRWQMTAPTPDGSSGDFTCISLGSNLRQPWDLYIFSVLLALLALPATTSLPLGEYRAGPPRRSRSTRLRRWSFLAGKMVLVLSIVYFVSIDLAYLRPHIGANTPQYIQLVSCFSFCLWGLRWILRDQRQRCPVCLGKLTHPARVGHPSRNFLAWNGTELICAGGHGLLHVPEIPTSWFSTQRWLYLDPSWEVLFPDPGLISPALF